MRFTIPTSLTVFSEVKALFHAINLFLYWQQKYYMTKMNWTEKNLCVWPKMNIIVCHSTILFTCIFQCHKVEKKKHLSDANYAFLTTSSVPIVSNWLQENWPTQRQSTHPHLTIWQQTKQNNTHVPHANINASNGVGHLNILYCRHYIDS